MLAILYIYTAIFFSFVLYLFYLRYNNIVKYTNTLFNLHFYVFVIYLLLFIISGLFSLLAYSFSSLGVAFAEVFKELNTESLNAEQIVVAKDSSVLKGGESSGSPTPNTPSEIKGGVKEPAGPLVDKESGSIAASIGKCVGDLMFNQFKNATDELTINNQKIVLSEMESFVTQKDTVPAKEVGVETGNIKAPLFNSAVQNKQGAYSFSISVVTLNMP